MENGKEQDHGVENVVAPHEVFFLSTVELGRAFLNFRPQRGKLLHSLQQETQRDGQVCRREAPGKETAVSFERIGHAFIDGLIVCYLWIPVLAPLIQRGIIALPSRSILKDGLMVADVSGKPVSEMVIEDRR